MATAQLTAVVSTKGVTTANRELTKLSTNSRKVETNVVRAENRFKSFGKNASAAIAAVDGPLGGISSRVSALTTVATAGGVAITGLALGVTALTFGLVKGISLLDEYNVNLKRVNATIAATGAGVGFTGEQLQEQAESLAIATLTSVDAVQKAQAKLLTFNRVLGDEFERSIGLSQDLAEAGFGSIESNAILLGKALQDPIKGMAALSRVGVTLSESQKQLAKDAFEVGDVFAAQGIILDAISGQVKGVGAAVAGGTLAGELDTTGIALERLSRNFAESTGILSTWQQIVRGAGRAANDLASALAGPTSDDLFSKSLELSIELAAAENKLIELEGKKGNAYNRQAAIVAKLRGDQKAAVAEASEAAEQENKKIVAEGEAYKKQLSARKSIEEQIRSEQEVTAQVQKDKEAAILQRAKDSAQSQLEIFTQLNATELEQIDNKEQQRLDKLKSFRNAELVGLEEFNIAKTEIELNAKLSRDVLAQEEMDRGRANFEEKNALALNLANTFSSDLAGGIVDAAAAGESLGDSVKASVVGISKSIIKAGIEQLIQTQVIDGIVGKLFLKSKIAETESQVAQAGLNAFAATAAIPVTGPAAAPAAATAATAIAQGFATASIGAAAAREQGGTLNAGQDSTFAERGQLEILTPSNSSRVRTAQQMKSIMGEGGNSSPVINVVNIDQSTGGVSVETSTDDDGRIINLIRDTVSNDNVTPNSQIAKSISNGFDVQVRR